MYRVRSARYAGKQFCYTKHAVGLSHCELKIADGHIVYTPGGTSTVLSYSGQVVVYVLKWKEGVVVPLTLSIEMCSRRPEHTFTQWEYTRGSEYVSWSLQAHIAYSQQSP